MMRILFLILCFLPVLQSQSQGAIEIIVDGHRYGSLQQYQASRKSAAIKTFQVNHGKVSDAVQHQLYVLSVESGVIGALQNFDQTRGEFYQMPQRISSERLQEAIQQAVTKSKDPKLLISSPGKLRVMGLVEGRT